MKRQLLWFSLLAWIVAGCAAPTSAPGPSRANPNPDLAPLNEETFLFEVLRFVYLWYFDESYFIVPNTEPSIEVWTRLLERELDEGDRSQYAEMWIPSINLLLELKRSDYNLPEMGMVAKDDTFKIQMAERVTKPPARKSHYAVRSLPRERVREYLFRTRNERLFPGEILRAKGRQAILEHLREEQREPYAEAQVFYTAPISPVSNNVWVFWENRRELLQFSADMDLSNPSFWEHTPLMLDVFNLDQDVVASQAEVPGSNAYITKDWVGRVLYNCIVLGQKRTVTPKEANRIDAELRGNQP